MDDLGSIARHRLKHPSAAGAWNRISKSLHDLIWVGSVVAAVRFVLEIVDEKRENKSNDGTDALLFAYIALPMRAAAYFLRLWVTRH